MGLIVRGYPVPANEAERLAALQALDLIGSAREPQFDAIVALARKSFAVPIALVSLVDDHQQWFKASEGLDLCSTDRESAFCNHAVAMGKMLVVEDATLDERFKRNALVTGEPRIRFYAGAPLALDPGIHLGTLCIVDTRPRSLSTEEADRLVQMAGVVNALLRQHRDTRAVARLAADLNEQVCVNEVQKRSLLHYKLICDRSAALGKMGAWDCDLATNEVTWTDGMYDIHELRRNSPIDMTKVYEYYKPEDHKQLARLRSDLIEHGRGFNYEAEITTTKGNKRWVRVAVDMEFENGAPVRLFGIKQDITEQKQAWERMRVLAEYDVLTGLPNRGSFQSRLSDAPASEDEPTTLGILLLDLDGFKHINDTFGHSIGDECLKQVAERLRRVCDGSQLVARLGGDEFGVLFDTRHDRTALVECAKEMLAALRQPAQWRGLSFQLGASIGIALMDAADPCDTTQLLTQADLALYAAKSAGRDTFRFYSRELKQKADARFATVTSIARAFENRELELFYQPKIDLLAGGLSGFEALLRWRKADGEVVSAGAFSAALEDPTLAGPVGDWVVETALRQAEEWHRDGLRFGHVAINLSSTQFHEDGFAARLIERVSDHHLRPEMFQVEVTEGVFLGHGTNAVQKTLETLKEAGIRIALDDFGTGYASLVHLRTFPVDVIKIDRSFVKDFLTSPQDNAILQSTLFLARRLKLDVVAEGIEENDQFEFLKALGCRYGQGYLFSPAVPALEAARWCRPFPLAAVADSSKTQGAQFGPSRGADGFSKSAARRAGLS